VICAVEYVYLLWVLYRLLNGVSKTHASLMVIFGVAFVPIMCVNAVSEIAALMLLHGADFLPVFNQPQRESLAMVFLGVRGYGHDVGWIFGLWLFRFGVCVWKSGFLPRFLGALLNAACFGYLAVSLTSFLLPSYANIVSRLANIPLTGRTLGYLVASDSGNKGSTVVSCSIKSQLSEVLLPRSTDSERVVGNKETIAGLQCLCWPHCRRISSNGKG